MTERASQPRPACPHRTEGTDKPSPVTVSDRSGPWTLGELERPFTRELARRQTGALEVALLWHPCTDSLSVSVRDSSGVSGFRLEVNAAEAMEVFHHPYAYAASRGIQYWREDEAEVVDV
jgi:hypothetical protein